MSVGLDLDCIMVVCSLMLTFSREAPELNLFMSTFYHYPQMKFKVNHLIVAVDEPFIREMYCECLSVRLLHEYMLSIFETIASSNFLGIALVVAFISGCRLVIQEPTNSNLQDNKFAMNLLTIALSYSSFYQSGSFACDNMLES